MYSNFFEPVITAHRQVVRWRVGNAYYCKYGRQDCVHAYENNETVGWGDWRPKRYKL